jgi:hypothetical protein
MIGHAITDILTKPAASLWPSHGDFHPMNLYVSDHRVTAIDLDTFALRECEADIGYCLAQTASFGLKLFGSFHETEPARTAFIEECGPVEIPRVVAYMAWAFLQSVHYDACILKVKNDTAPQMIRAADELMRSGTVAL